MTCDESEPIRTGSVEPPDSGARSDEASPTTDDSRYTLSRRSLIGALGAGWLLPAVASTGGGTARAAGTGEKWTLVSIPDTQFYAENQGGDRLQYAHAQTQWIVDNMDSENVVFVTHVGDMVQDGSSEGEWDNIRAVMNRIHGEVPYSTLPGNHDWENGQSHNWGPSVKQEPVEKYRDYFGLSRFSEFPWYGGVGPDSDDHNRNVNAYQRFTGGGYDFLHLALEWQPENTTSDPSPMEWAQEVLDAHPDLPTIITTHEYLHEWDGRTDTGDAIFEQLVEPNPQVFMVLSGHEHGENHQVSQNDAGLDVYEMLANYQSTEPNGGNGYMQILEFVPVEDGLDEIQVRTYSPALDESKTDWDSQFSFELDFDERFAQTATTTFQQGSDGYSGTVDTYLEEKFPDTGNASEAELTVDSNLDGGNDSGPSAQALLRFEDIVGTESGRIPPGTQIQSATLTLETVDDGDGASLHRMLQSWSDTDTWNTFGGEEEAGGVQAGNEAASDPEVTTGSLGTGPTRIDVTESVQAWADGEANHGWVFLPSGGDGWDFESAEGGTPPTLTVSLPAEDGDVDQDGDVDEDDVELIQERVAGIENGDFHASTADYDGDGDVDIGDAMAVDGEVSD